MSIIIISSPSHRIRPPPTVVCVPFGYAHKLVAASLHRPINHTHPLGYCNNVTQHAVPSSARLEAEVGSTSRAGASMRCPLHNVVDGRHMLTSDGCPLLHTRGGGDAALPGCPCCMTTTAGTGLPLPSSYIHALICGALQVRWDAFLYPSCVMHVSIPCVSYAYSWFSSLRDRGSSNNMFVYGSARWCCQKVILLKLQSGPLHSSTFALYCTW